MATVHFDGVDVINDIDNKRLSLDHPELNEDHTRNLANAMNQQSGRSLISAPPAPPHEHRRASLQPHNAGGDEMGLYSRLSHDEGEGGGHHRYASFGGVSKRAAYREILQNRKRTIIGRHHILPSVGSEEGTAAAGEGSPLTGSDQKDYSNNNERTKSDATGNMSALSLEDTGDQPIEALKEMFLENKINVLLVFIPLAYWSHANKWNDGAVFILNFLAMVPLASMLGVFTEELAAHTNDVIGGLINATFGNAVELVVAIQALLANDFRVVQASLIGSVFSNLLLVLGMCFLMGGIKHSEQVFIAQGAVASIALLALCGLTLLLPEFFGEDGEDGNNTELTISRLGAMLLVLMYGQLLFFQLKTHVHLFEGDDDVVALIPFSWALTGLVVITGIVTILSEWLVGSIDGFCEEFNLGRSFVGVIILPVVGNAVEHISAVSVAMKNKMDLALGVALGSAVQIALFVLPVVVVVGWFTGKEMSLKFPIFEVILYLISVIIVSLCLSNERSNWLEGSLLVFTYAIIAIGVYFEKEVILE